MKKAPNIHAATCRSYRVTTSINISYTSEFEAVSKAEAEARASQLFSEIDKVDMMLFSQPNDPKIVAEEIFE